MPSDVDRAAELDSEKQKDEEKSVAESNFDVERDAQAPFSEASGRRPPSRPPFKQKDEENSVAESKGTPRHFFQRPVDEDHLLDHLPDKSE